MQEFWDKKYSDSEFVYGKEPNEFFKSEISKYPKGKLISFGEGEGRNAVYAAKLGWEVEAFDFSSEAKKKAEMIAEENNVMINYTIVDLEKHQPTENSYDLALIIYFHLAKEKRNEFFNKIISAIKNDGLVLMEVFDVDQLKYNSGGPKSPNLLYTLEDIIEGFIEFEFIKLTKEIIKLSEGKNHFGDASVIRFVARKR